ncbi:MFS transporter [Biostraticola tofi]|uniref:ACS family glucarate transporter-like MFS transporter n=1 Tax=Biostraticola tofi TaxID=466109 RepID=A0A4R3Z034_9GAMM|nr:MFS transporter [Biostraticola tofi]TCV98962.1 ACS family glucarate transporter-like MFS transporter [Biostraticola tofi]
MSSANHPVKPTAKTHTRFIILGFIFIATVFNYVDRATLSVAAPFMSKELGFDASMMGWAFSAFGWAYVLMQLPGGWILDKLGARLVYGVALIAWSAITVMQGYVYLFASPFIILFVLRFLMGAVEAPAFPANSRLSVQWFPNKERAFATSIYAAAQYISLALFTPLMTYILQALSWHYIFYYIGAAGIAIGIAWLWYVRDPQQHPGVNQAEIDYIRSGGGIPDLAAARKASSFNIRHIKALVSNRMMVGVYIGQFCLTSITWFFLTWFPTYLYQARGMTILKVGLVASIPAIAGFIGGILGGLFSDYLLRKGYSLTFARKTPVMAGMILSSVIICANYVSSDFIVVLVMSIAFFAKGFGNLGWCILSDTSPKEVLGIAGGLFNFFGNIASIVTPLLIGFILTRTGSFDYAILYVGLMGVIGTFAYIFIVGPLKRLEID